MEGEWVIQMDYSMEARYLGLTDPRHLLGFLASARKGRLFACACCRYALVVARVTDERPRISIAAMEREADVGSTPVTARDRLRAEEARDDARRARRARTVGERSLQLRAKWNALDCVCLLDADLGDGYPRSDFLSIVARTVSASQLVDPDAIDLGGVDLSVCADLLRDVVGNPYAPTFVLPRDEGETLVRYQRVPEEIAARQARCVRDDWLTRTTVSLARAAYEERLPSGFLDPARLAVLSDALEEAGCHLRDGSLHPVLAHLRSTTPHVRGCWVLDLILDLR